MVVAVEEERIRLLLVDDHMLVRAGLRSVLEQVSDLAVVGEASSGEEAVARVQDCRPDVVLMDLDMPGEGGITATRTLTRGESHPVVLVVTMHEEDWRLVEALRAGATGYITKTVAQQELVSAIRAVAAGDVYVRPNAARVLAATLRPVPPPPVDAIRRKFDALSTRERAVLALVAQGHTGPEIGAMLGVRAKTVDTYRHRIQRKIGLLHRKDYIRFALALNLLSNE